MRGMAGQLDIHAVLNTLLESPESEVVEFKEAKQGKFVEHIGKYFSALSNEANLRDRKFAWLCFGIGDKRDAHGRRKVVGTTAQIGEDLKRQVAQSTTHQISIREAYDVAVEGKRVVLIQIPAAPPGTPVAWKGVCYGRNGESLSVLSLDKYNEIRAQSGLPDWSAEIISSATLDDLDERAIAIMKERYAAKHANDDFRSLPALQVLSDLGLVTKNGITHAALILVGKKDSLKKNFPHSAIILEYRSSEAEIEFSNRMVYDDCFFLSLDKLWHDINVRNEIIPIQDGPYIFNIPYFNESVIREALCNAVAHRDYHIASETVVKQYPQKIVITNAGGFPMGVTKNNIIAVPSTPRNRLLSDVLAKTGIVERSGQGVDKIFKNTLSEGKSAPDYSQSNDYMVELSLSAAVIDKAFAMFVKEVQERLSPENRLSVFEVVALDKIRQDDYADVSRELIQTLLKKGLIERSGKTRATRYYLPKRYYELAHDIPAYMSRKDEWDSSLSIPLVSVFLKQKGEARMKDFEQLFGDHLERKQVKALIKNLIDQKIIYADGRSSGTKYRLTQEGPFANELYLKAMKIGMEILKNQFNGSSVL